MTLCGCACLAHGLRNEMHHRLKRRCWLMTCSSVSRPTDRRSVGLPATEMPGRCWVTLVAHPVEPDAPRFLSIHCGMWVLIALEALLRLCEMNDACIGHAGICLQAVMRTEWRIRWGQCSEKRWTHMTTLPSRPGAPGYQHDETPSGRRQVITARRLHSIGHPPRFSIVLSIDSLRAHPLTWCVVVSRGLASYADNMDRAAAGL